MISIKRRDSKVEVELESKLPHSNGSSCTPYLFHWNCMDTQYAELLMRHFNKLLRERMEEIRRGEYERGFYDGRRHQPRRTNFSGSL